MIGLLKIELLKLNRSLVLLVLLGIPGILYLMEVAIVATGNSSEEWLLVAVGGTSIFAFFLMSMTITAMTALQAQIEHSNNAWSYTLSLPVPRYKIFLAKAIISVLMLLVITILVGTVLILGGLTAGLISPENALTGDIPVKEVSMLLGLMWLAGLLMTAIQFVVAMRFTSFAIPAVVGIGGTLVSMIATSARQGLYFPWLLPINVQAAETGRAIQAVLTGSIGGIIVFLIGIIWLSRRDWN